MAERDKKFLKSVKYARTTKGKDAARDIKQGRVRVRKSSRAVRNKSVAAYLKIADRRSQAAALRVEGLSYAEIARVMRKTMKGKIPPGYSEETARMDVDTYLDTIQQQNVSQVSRWRKLEALRMDWMTTKLVELINKGHVSVVTGIDLLLKVSTRRAKLLGLDAPVQVDTRLFGDIQISYGGLDMTQYDKAADDPDTFIDPEYEYVGEDDEKALVVMED